MIERDEHKDIINKKILKLVAYIKSELPDGCGHPNSEYDCHEGCPLYKCGDRLEYNICIMLSPRTLYVDKPK